MANHMDTRVSVTGLTERGISYLEKLFELPEGEYEVTTEQFLERLYGELPEDYDRSYITEKLGSKWMYGYMEYADGEEAELSLTSAWSVPVSFLETLANQLAVVQGENPPVVYGTYLDEGYDPCGAFVYAVGYEDIEDVYGYNCEEEVDTDQIWEDDEYSESIYESLAEARDRMLSGYYQIQQELKEESNG